MTQVKGKVREPWFAVGQSTGGAILIDYLLSNRQSQQTSAFRNVVLLAPVWMQVVHLLAAAGFVIVRLGRTRRRAAEVSGPEG